MKPNPQLVEFLSPFSKSIQELTIELRSYIIGLIPEANELIWDNYNALAIAYSKSEKLKDAFCHISVYSKHVNFGFNRGAELNGNSKIKLEGTGKLIRHIKVTNIDLFKTTEMEAMIREALGISENRNEKLSEKENEGKSIVMSISKKKRRPS